MLVGATLILQAFERGVVLGRLDLDVSDGKLTARRYRLLAVTDATGEDPAVAARVADYQRRLGDKMNEPVGTAAVDLDGGKDAMRRGDGAGDRGRRCARPGAGIAWSTADDPAGFPPGRSHQDDLQRAAVRN
jgi:hypothetical protein